MRARLVVVLVTCAALLPLTLSAQLRGNGRVPGISHAPQAPPPGAPVAPPSGPGSGPGRSFHPLPRSSAPPSQPLPVPFAGTVPDPFIEPAPIAHAAIDLARCFSLGALDVRSEIRTLVGSIGWLRGRIRRVLRRGWLLRQPSGDAGACGSASRPTRVVRDARHNAGLR